MTFNSQVLACVSYAVGLTSVISYRDAVGLLPQEEFRLEFSSISGDKFAIHSLSKHQWISFSMF